MKTTPLFFRIALFSFILFSSISTYSQSVATYDITFTSVWNATDHGTLPGGAHWSNLIGANHNMANEFLEMGMQASQGIEDVAEVGVNTAFTNEINAQIAASTAEQLINISSVGTATGTVTISGVKIDEQYPLLTLASMIAPSPDWFIAINSFNLRQGGNWIQGNTNIDLFPYDAGTENGTMYSTSNTATMPQGNITSLVNVGFFNNQRIGYFTITFVSSLSVDKESINESVKLYPNPSFGEISIINSQNIDLKRLEVYNLVGKLVRKINLNNSTDKIDLKNISQGIYFAKIISESGKIKTQKLIIK